MPIIGIFTYRTWNLQDMLIISLQSQFIDLLAYEIKLLTYRTHHHKTRSLLDLQDVLTHIVVDEVQVVPGSDGHSPPTSLDKPGVGLMQCLVHVHKGVDDGLTMSGRLRQLRGHGRKQVRTHILQQYNQINRAKEILKYPYKN